MSESAPINFWDERYTQVPDGFGHEPNEFLKEQVTRFQQGGELYLPGDGYGRNGLWLARRGFQVTIVDSSAVGIDQARAAAEAEQLPLRAEVADLREYIPAPCDGALLVFIHLPEEGRKWMHGQAWNALRPGGVLLVEAFHPNQRLLGRTSGGPRNPEMLVTAAQLRGDFPGARIELLEEATVELQEGPFHSGVGDVVRLLAVKP